MGEGSSVSASPDASPSNSRARDQLANERTLLAWVRTAIALMGLGFVVARFGLFLREIAAIAGQHLPAASPYSAPIGIVLIAFGLLTIAMGVVRFWRARNQIRTDNFEAALIPPVAIVAFVLASGVGLFAYLLLAER